MYTIIYWKGDNEVYPTTNPNGTIRLYDTLEEADKKAMELDLSDDEIGARVISINGVQESETY